MPPVPPERTLLLPSSDAAWPDVKRSLSAALEAVVAEQDLSVAWQHLCAASSCARSHSHRRAGMLRPGSAAASATANGAPRPVRLPTAWPDCAGGGRQRCATALADVIRAALDLDSAAAPGGVGMAMFTPITGSGGCWSSTSSSCSVSVAFARSLVACSLLGLLLPPCRPEQEEEQEKVEKANKTSGKADSCWHEEEEEEGLHDQPSPWQLANWSRSLLHMFGRPAAEVQESMAVIVTRTEKPNFVGQQPQTLDEWCREEALLCAVLVTGVSDVTAATTPTGVGDDVCLELTAASLLLLQQLPDRPLAEGEVLQIERSSGGGAPSCTLRTKQDHRDVLALSQGDLRWLTDYQQHVCTSADCCADCHVLWQLALTYVRLVVGSAVAADPDEAVCAADSGYGSQRQSCEVPIHSQLPRSGSPSGFLYGSSSGVGAAGCCHRGAPADHLHSAAAEPVEYTVQLHSAARLRSPALVAPAIVVCESACDAEQGIGASAAAATWGGDSACDEDGTSCFSTLNASLAASSSSSHMLDHRDTSVTAFADALATSLLGDALTGRPLLTRSDTERRPSMPTIVEEAPGSGGSGCGLVTGVCCGGGDDTGGEDDAAAHAVTAASVAAAAAATAGAKPLSDFAERLAADVLRDALRMTRSDSLPPEEVHVDDDDRAPSPAPPQLLARCSSVSSEAAAGSVCSWQSLEDFSHGLLVSAILEAKQEWFGRLAAAGGGGGSSGESSHGSDDVGDDGAERRAASEHARFFQWEFLDRAISPCGGGWPPAGGRRGSEPTGWAAAVGGAAAMERRGSAPCMSAAKRSLTADRRPSDYFDDEFVRRLHCGGSGRRGSAPAVHGGGRCADQSDDDYFDAEFALATRLNSVSFSGDAAAVTADQSLPNDGDTASLAESGCCCSAAGYLSLYSDVLVENVMRSGFKELARRVASAVPPGSGSEAAEVPPSSAGALPASRAAAAAVAEDVDGFAVRLAEQLMSDALGSLRSERRSCGAGEPAAMLAVPGLTVGHEDDNETGDDDEPGEGALPDPDALALRRRSSGRRHSRTVRSGQQQQQAALPLPPTSRRVAPTATLAASWECGSGGACDEAQEQLAALLRWIAASVAGVGELNMHVSQGLLAEKLEAVVRQALSMQLRAGDLTSLVLEYCRARQRRCGSAQMPFAYVSERM